jgi:hypothetical protein
MAQLWTALVGPPSTKKTPIIREASRALKAIDNALSRAYAAAKAAYDALANDVKKSTPAPAHVRVILDDTTVEAAQEILCDSPDGVLYLHDELAGFFGGLDKYSGQRGGIKDRSFWNRAYNGDSYKFDRVARGSGFIERLAICLTGGIQPEVLQSISAEVLDDGLIQRIVPVLLQPASMSEDRELPGEARAYADVIQALHALPQLPHAVTLSDEAMVLRAACEEKHLKWAQVFETLNRKLAAHLGKYDGLFARLCLIWHCVEAAERQEALPAIVTVETAQRVAKFMHEFLLPHAIAVYISILGLSDDQNELAAVADHILAHELPVLTNRDLGKGCRSLRKLLKRSHQENVCQQLENLGWLMRIPGRNQTQPPRWLVNPKVHERYRERAAKERKRRQQVSETLAEFFGKRPFDSSFQGSQEGA